MPLYPSTKRRIARDSSAVAATLAAIVLSVSLAALVSPDSVAAAAQNAGSAQIAKPKGEPGAGDPLAEGGSETSFNLKVPAGAACLADGLNGGRWHTYIVPGDEDPAAVQFSLGTGKLIGEWKSGDGPFRQNLYTTTGSPVLNQAPDVESAAIINVPNTNFKVFPAGAIKAGVYNLGIACVDLDAEPTPTTAPRDRFWNAQIRVEADAADPKGMRWVSLSSAAPSASPSKSPSPSPSPSPSKSPSPSPSPSKSPSPSPSPSPSKSPSPSPSPSAGLLELSTRSAVPGGAVEVRAGGFRPEAEVKIVIKSEPVELATVAADLDGVVEALVTIPADMPTGDHTLEVSGTGADGSALVLSAPFTVTAPTAVDTTTTTAFTAGGPGTGGPLTGVGTGGGALPRTGSTVARAFISGLLLLVFGRMALLLGRPLSVRQGTER